jgi:thiol-disulfide isomerase/thioredoxin
LELPHLLRRGFPAHRNHNYINDDYDKYISRKTSERERYYKIYLSITSTIDTSLNKIHGKSTNSFCTEDNGKLPDENAKANGIKGAGHPTTWTSMREKHNLEKLRENSQTVKDYLASTAETAPGFAKRTAEYNLNERATKELRERAEGAVVVVFSAEWCKDCRRNVPVLGLIAEATDLEVRVFGHLMRDIKDPDELWSIPPSPQEVKEFDVVKIPLISVLDGNGEKIGEIVENPLEGQSLEEALLDILKKA